MDLEEFSDAIEPWVIEALKNVGCDTARQVLELSAEELVRRTDLVEETIKDVMRILAEDAARLPAVVLHCFSGSEAMAAEAWSRGYFIGVGGPVTYAGAGALREILAGAPRDRILLETDAPYLPPTPHRGKRNEPAYLRLVVERLATLWDAAPDSVAEAVARNISRAFGIPLEGAQG